MPCWVDLGCGWWSGKITGQDTDIPYKKREEMLPGEGTRSQGTTDTSAYLQKNTGAQEYSNKPELTLGSTSSSVCDTGLVT